MASARFRRISLRTSFASGPLAWLAGWLAALALYTHAGSCQTTTKADAPLPRAGQMPSWAAAEKIVTGHLRTLPDYQPGDMLSRGRVEPVFQPLRAAGWKVSDASAIVASLSDDQDLLVRQFGTPAGRKCMRRVAKVPRGYDWMHRLAWAPRGSQTVRDLVKLPNGPDVIESLLSSPGGKDIRMRLADGAKSSEFDKPTGRIYTEAQLLDRLRQSYDRDAATPPKSR